MSSFKKFVVIGFMLAATEAFAANGDLIVDGNLGVGTTNYVGKLSVQAPDGSQAFGSQIAAVAGGTAQGQRAVVSFYPTFQGTSDNGPRRAADITGGFAGGAWGNEYLSFNVGVNLENDAGNLNIERMRIIGNGNVGIGTTTPMYPLDVIGNIRAANVSVTSDIRFKENIQPVGAALDKISRIQGVTYTWKQHEFKNNKFPDGRHYGVIAQEIEKVLPEVVNTAADGYKSVSYTELIPVLIEAIKEQQKRIEALEKVIAAGQTVR